MDSRYQDANPESSNTTFALLCFALLYITLAFIFTIMLFQHITIATQPCSFHYLASLFISSSHPTLTNTAFTPCRLHFLFNTLYLFSTLVSPHPQHIHLSFLLHCIILITSLSLISSAPGFPSHSLTITHIPL
jgi:hypothetical protein